MASITSLGVGSGLDSEAIVRSLVAAERMVPDARLKAIEDLTSARISAFGKIRAALSGVDDTLFKFVGTGSLVGRTATPGVGAGFTATVAEGSALGSYQVVVEKLASSHKLQSTQVATGVQVGNGTLSIAIGADAAVDVAIAPGAGSLAEIRDAINAAGAGVVASIISGDAGDALTLTSSRSGAAGAISVTATGGDGGLAMFDTTSGSMTTTSVAQDASVLVDGVRKTSSTNVVTGTADGVTLTLTKADPAAFDLTVGSDTSTLKASMLNFVAAYNVALNNLSTQSKSSTDGTASGPLSGDALTRGISTTLRNTVSGNYAAMADLGLKTNVDGTLSLDGTKFDAALAANPNAVKNLLSPDGPLGSQLKADIANYIGADGLVTSKTKGLAKTMDKVESDREKLDVRMTAIEARYRKQFAGLDSVISRLNGLNSYITQQLSMFTNIMKDSK